MKKRLTIMLICLFGMSRVSNILAENTNGNPLTFTILIYNPADDNANNGGSPRPRGPVAPPVVAQDGSTLYILGGCDEADLVILDGEEEEVYTCQITEDTYVIVLPDTLQGTYQLQIQRGQFTFVTEIEL